MQIYDRTGFEDNFIGKKEDTYRRQESIKVGLGTLIHERYTVTEGFMYTTGLDTGLEV